MGLSAVGDCGIFLIILTYYFLCVWSFICAAVLIVCSSLENNFFVEERASCLTLIVFCCLVAICFLSTVKPVLSSH